ncbi:MAG: hypothetical protein U1E53_18855 [Dongiaceae bacterium]
MRSRNVTVIDVVSLGRGRKGLGRLVNANLASLMPQAIAAWCEELGHRVRFVCYTQPEDLDGAFDDTDLLFVSAFTRAAQTAYAVSNMARRRGIVTALGGPHARCYPEDAARYFDYVLGLTDKATLTDVLQDCGPHRPLGRQLAARRQPSELPGARQRWRFIEATIAKSPLFKTIPMLGSLGCPYSCAFCIDSTVPYQPLSYDGIAEDLRFLQTRLRRPRVAWLDPNFGVRFDDYLQTIERAAPGGRVRFIAESSLSLLSEPNLKRLAAAGFDGMLPGIESWYGLGNKSRTGAAVGIDKVRRVAEHINLVLRHIPYVQANFILGLDDDEGDEPFELTKRFLDLAPGVYPAFSLLTAYGRAAPGNLDLQRAGRVLPFPFRFLDSQHAMNVRPRNYGWPEFYDHVVDLNRYALSRPRVARRFIANRGVGTRFVNVVRAVRSNRVDYQSRIRAMLEGDREVRAFFEGETRTLPAFYANRLRSGLGPLWEHLPREAVMHDERAWLHAGTAEAA